MSETPQDWGAVPFSNNPADWGAVQVNSALDPQTAAYHLQRLAQAQRDLDNAPVAAPPGPYEREGHGILRANQGVEHLLRKLADAVGLPGRSKEMATEMTQDEAAYQQHRGSNVGIDWWSGVGSAIPGAPLALVAPEAGLASVAANRAVQGGAAGLVGGLLQPTYTPSLTDNLKNAAVGGVTGAAAAPAIGAVTDVGMGLAKKLVGALRGARADKSIADIAEQIPELKTLDVEDQAKIIAEARQQLSATGNLDAVALGRKTNLLAQGLTPTKAIVTRDPIDWTRERNLQKLAQSQDPVLNQVGTELTDLYRRNDAKLTSNLDRLGGALPAGSAEEHGLAVMRDIGKVANQSQKAVGESYAAARGNDVVNPPLNALTEKLFSPDIQDIEDPAVRSITGTVQNRLRRLGIIEPVPEPQPGFGSPAFQLTGKSPTAAQSEELRKLLNGLDAPNANSLRIKTQLVQALDDATTSLGGQDVFGTARAQAAARFGMLQNPAAERALNTLGEIQQGKASQQFIRSQVIGASAQDVNSLLNVLNRSEDKGGLQHLQAGVLQYLQGKAVNPNSGQFSGASLNKAMREIGDAKLNAILGENMADKLRSISRAALDATYEPAYSAVNHSNTAPMLSSALEKGRALLGVNLPFGLNDTAVKIANRAGYQSQLAQALAARSAAPAVELSPQARALADALQKVGALQAATQVAPSLTQQRNIRQ